MTMYKLVFILIVAAVSCASGSPACSNDVADKCGGGRTMDDLRPTTPAGLDALCPDAMRELNCQVDFANRCPNTMTGAFKDTLVKYRELFENLCRNTDLRRMYLKNAVCVNKVIEESERTCANKYTDYCKQLNYSFECGRNNVVETCGSNEAGEVYDALLKPMKNFGEVFGCKDL